MTTTEQTKITDDSFPSLFQAANQASVKAQQNHLRLMRIDIFLMIIAAALLAYSFSDETTKSILTITGAALLGLTILLTTLIKLIRYDKIWYDGRAVAESVKTLSWRYMTCAEPFAAKKEIAEIDRQFTENLLSILEERKDLASSLGGSQGPKPQITEAMRGARELTITQRKDLYIAQRIKDQEAWYSEKSNHNKHRETNWFWVIIASQILALAAAIIVIRFPTTAFNLTGLFTTIAAGAIAWLQLKQHQALSQAYGLAAQELGLIVEQGRHLKSDKELSAFVSDAENAISREHTMWLARKVTL